MAYLLALGMLCLLGGVVTVTLAEAADRALRIGILSSGTVEIRGGLEQSLLQGLHDQGYVEGKNLVVERRYASSLMESMSDAARELGDMKLDASRARIAIDQDVAKFASLSVTQASWGIHNLVNETMARRFWGSPEQALPALP